MQQIIASSVWTIVPELSSVMCEACVQEIHPGEHCEHFKVTFENDQLMVFQDSGQPLIITPPPT